MKEYVLITDSTTDFEYSVLQDKNIPVVKLKYTIDDQEFDDDMDEQSTKKFYEKLRAGALPRTSGVNVETFKELFSKYLNEGKDILCACFSSALSVTYSSAVTAARELSEAYPDSKICVVDTKCASLGEGLLVKLMDDLKNEGMPIDELVAWTEENKLKINHWVAVDDLHHLHRGGRVSGAAALIGSLLNAKPIIHVNDQGQLVPVAKVLGRKKSLHYMVDKMQELAIEPAKQSIFISHADCYEDAEYLKQLIEKKFAVKDVYINYIGTVIGSHTGAGTLALFFMGKNRG